MESTNLIEIRPNRRINVYHSEIGSKKTLFLLHGFGGRHQQWQGVINFFKNDYNIVAADWFGLGDSDKPTQENSYLFKEFYADHAALLERFASEENYIIGHSYGCTLALVLAANFPKLIKKITLITPMTFPYDLGVLKAFQMPTFMLNAMQPMMTKQFFQAAFMAGTDPSIIEQEVNASNKNSMAIIKEMALDIANITLPELSKMTLPVLIILADHDRITPGEQSKTCYQVLPGVQFITLENSGHMVLLEQPAKINNLIADFISVC